MPPISYYTTWLVPHPSTTIPIGLEISDGIEISNQYILFVTRATEATPVVVTSSTTMHSRIELPYTHPAQHCATRANIHVAMAIAGTRKSHASDVSRYQQFPRILPEMGCQSWAWGQSRLRWRNENKTSRDVVAEMRNCVTMMSLRSDIGIGADCHTVLVVRVCNHKKTCMSARASALRQRCPV